MSLVGSISLGAEFVDLGWGQGLLSGGRSRGSRECRAGGGEKQRHAHGSSWIGQERASRPPTTHVWGWFQLGLKWCFGGTTRPGARSLAASGSSAGCRARERHRTLHERRNREPARRQKLGPRTSSAGRPSTRGGPTRTARTRHEKTSDPQTASDRTPGVDQTAGSACAPRPRRCG